MANAPQPISPGHPDHQPGLPAQVKRQIAETEALMASMNVASSEEAQPPAQATPEGEHPAAAPPPAGDGSQHPAQPVASTPPAEDEQTWEQRFKSQQGRFDQMLRANEALSSQVSELRQGIAALQARGAQAAPPTPAAERTPPSYVKPEEVEEYGPEFIDIVGRRAKEVYSPEFEELADRLKRLEGQVAGVGQVVSSNVKQSMYQTLDHDVPNWKDVNRSAEFKAWLQQPDPYSGRRRHEMLTEAYSGHETGRVLSFFKGFLTEAAGLPPSSQARTPSAPPLPGNGNGSGKPSLADFAAPGRASSAPQNLPPEKPIYTQAWIADFYAQKLAGRYRGREADADAIERDIFKAQHEGRVQL